jgi:hypothetical protein
MVLATLARHRFVERVPARLRPALIPAILAAIVVATALPLDHAHQQHSRDRAQIFRDVYTYVDNNADGNERIYTADNDFTILYTRRVLAFLSGYKRWKAGWGSFAEARQAHGGWAVVSSLENKYAEQTDQVTLDAVPANWLEVYRAEQGRQWARVYKILPQPLPEKLAVIERNVPLDLSGLPLAAVAPAEIVPTDRWNRGVTAPVFEHQPDGVSVSATAAAGADRSLVGVVFPLASGIRAMRFDLHVEGDVDSVFIYTNGGRGARGAQRWRWQVKDQEHDVTEALAPGGHGVRFQPIQSSLPPDQVREVHVFVHLKRGKTGGFTLRNVQVAPAL